MFKGNIWQSQNSSGGSGGGGAVAFPAIPDVATIYQGLTPSPMVEGPVFCVAFEGKGVTYSYEVAKLDPAYTGPDTAPETFVSDLVVTLSSNNLFALVTMDATSEQKLCNLYAETVTDLFSTTPSTGYGATLLPLCVRGGNTAASGPLVLDAESASTVSVINIEGVTGAVGVWNTPYSSTGDVSFKIAPFHFSQGSKQILVGVSSNTPADSATLGITYRFCNDSYQNAVVTNAYTLNNQTITLQDPNGNGIYPGVQKVLPFIPDVGDPGLIALIGNYDISVDGIFAQKVSLPYEVFSDEYSQTPTAGSTRFLGAQIAGIGVSNSGKYVFALLPATNTSFEVSLGIPYAGGSQPTSTHMGIVVYNTETWDIIAKGLIDLPVISGFSSTIRVVEDDTRHTMLLAIENNIANTPNYLVDVTGFDNTAIVESANGIRDIGRFPVIAITEPIVLTGNNDHPLISRVGFGLSGTVPEGSTDNVVVTVGRDGVVFDRSRYTTHLNIHVQGSSCGFAVSPMGTLDSAAVTVGSIAGESRFNTLADIAAELDGSGSQYWGVSSATKAVHINDTATPNGTQIKFRVSKRDTALSIQCFTKITRDNLGAPLSDISVTTHGCPVPSWFTGTVTLEKTAAGWVNSLHPQTELPAGPTVVGDPRTPHFNSAVSGGPALGGGL